MKKLLIVDHYDSFTYLIKSYFQQLNMETIVVAYHDPILLDLDNIKPDAIVLSPGPGHPSETPETRQLIQKYYLNYPILGICLGMQAIAEAFGGLVVAAQEVVHGKQSLIHHHATGLFQALPSPFYATRYHSLVVDEATLPAIFQTEAWAFTAQGQQILMGIKHRSYPVYGVQFHPEAILSQHGLTLLGQFLINQDLRKTPISSLDSIFNSVI